MITLYPYITNIFPSNAKSIKEADVVVFGVPYDSTVDFLPGTRFGPRIIREASNFIEPFDTETEKNLLDEVKIIDIGDLEPVRGNSEKTVERVKGQMQQILQKNKFPLILGGEHLISLGAVKALPKDTRLVCFDAHYDLKEVWEGSEYTHNTWLRRACEVIGSDNVCLIGVRTGDEFEFEYAKKEKILVNPTQAKLKEFVKGKKVYLSIDMDVFDPSIAPGVGTPEPGGLNYQDVLDYLKTICNNSKVIGFDVTEVRPLAGNRITEVLSSKIIFKILVYTFQKIK